MTERPLPRQSRSSAWARCRTASGSAAGPAQKLKARLLTSTLAIGRADSRELSADVIGRAGAGARPEPYSSLPSASAAGSDSDSADSPRDSAASSPSGRSSSSPPDGSWTRSRPTSTSSLASLIRVTPWVLRPDRETSSTRVPHQGALVGNQHDLLAFLDLYRGDQRAVALVGDHGDHPWPPRPRRGNLLSGVRLPKPRSEAVRICAPDSGISMEISCCPCPGACHVRRGRCGP